MPQPVTDSAAEALCFGLCLWVRACMRSRSLLARCLKNPMDRISPNLVYGVVEATDELILKDVVSRSRSLHGQIWKNLGPHISRGVYPYLPLATNAQRTIWGDFIKSL